MKTRQLQGGFALLTRGFAPNCPWTPLGAKPPDPHYRLALRARHMAPLSKLLDPPVRLWASAPSHKFLATSLPDYNCVKGNMYWSTESVLIMITVSINSSLDHK